jgi:hypothetical protein
VWSGMDVVFAMYRGHWAHESLRADQEVSTWLGFSASDRRQPASQSRSPARPPARTLDRSPPSKP